MCHLIAFITLVSMVDVADFHHVDSEVLWSEIQKNLGRDILNGVTLSVCVSVQSPFVIQCFMEVEPNRKFPPLLLKPSKFLLKWSHKHLNTSKQVISAQRTPSLLQLVSSWHGQVKNIIQNQLREHEDHLQISYLQKLCKAHWMLNLIKP